MGLTCHQSYLTSIVSVTQEVVVHTRFVGYNLVPVTNTILFYIHIHEIGMGAIVIVRRCNVYTHSLSPGIYCSSEFVLQVYMYNFYFILFFLIFFFFF